ncbi:B18 subunit of NADH:ubiquinone oxidoreductase [Mycena floridula]|nr:B18 subunit of NADH:ubiquinone oxidoreductase [Mycena floridula]
MPTSTTASQEELKANRVPLGWRDNCSALLIPLNLCRKQNYYLPWECQDQKHVYEKCQYDDYMRRMSALAKRKQSVDEE